MGLQRTILRLFPQYRLQARELEAARLKLASAKAPVPAPARVPVPLSAAPRYLIAKSSTVGIGNRLLFLAGCLFLGRETGRRVIVDWRDGMFGDLAENSFWSYFEESDAFLVREFSFLEEAPPGDFTMPEWAGHLPLDIVTRCRLQRESQGLTGPVNGAVLAETGWKYHGYFGPDLPERILVTYGGKSRLSEFPPARLKAQFPALEPNAEAVIGHLLRAGLRPGPELRRRRDEFAAAHFQGRPVLGVHLRNTDKTPTRPIEELLAEARALAETIAGEGTAPAIFLATDHEPTQHLFRQAFGERLLVVPKWFDPAAAALHYSKNADAAQKRAMGLEALLDLYLLARCGYLYLQPNSTFSRIAAYLTEAPAARLHWHSTRETVPWTP